MAMLRINIQRVQRRHNDYLLIKENCLSSFIRSETTQQPTTAATTERRNGCEGKENSHRFLLRNRHGRISGDAAYQKETHRIQLDRWKEEFYIEYSGVID